MGQSNTTLRKNPSRETCENVIRRILMAETLETGRNEHFRSAADFMSYFESLYPASDALTKQVQRAIKAMNMPKDKNGYFIPNKTSTQLAQEEELTAILQKSNAAIIPMDSCEPVFLQVDAPFKSYLIHVLEHSPQFEGKYLTILDTTNGLIFYTNCRQQLELLLNSSIVR